MLPELDETIRAEMERSDLTGLAVALVKWGEVIAAEGYGTASIDTHDPITPETTFSIMSVTKTIVATAMMQLRDEGHFQLDDPANKYLAPVSIKNEWESESPVTIRQLLTHTSGLPVGIGTNPEGKHTLEGFVDLVAKTERRPGEAIVYANWGYDALGVLVERFSRVPVDEYVRRHIFEPLAMRSSVLGEPLPGATRATGHYVSSLDNSRHAMDPPDWNTTPASPEGGCWSTVLDLAAFLIAHVQNGDPILEPDTAWEMHRAHATQGLPHSGMGLGFRVTRSNNCKLICHGGDGGGFTAFIGAYPRAGMGVAVLMNTAGMQVARSVIANTALRLLVRGGKPKRRTLPSAEVTAGKYQSTFWDIDVEVRVDDLPTLTTTEGLVVADDAGVSSLFPTDPSRKELPSEVVVYEGAGGMFHGFEVTFKTGDKPSFSGGVYPFEFVRTGDITVHEAIDETTDLTGTWQGEIRTPMGALTLTIEVMDDRTAGLITPLGSAELAHFRAQAGRMQADFPMSLPGIGNFDNFLRLEARGGGLTGKLYARSKFGETIMPTYLSRV